ncbi:MAG: VOC family protein [Novosphingobium sp.]|nr:VOC family protein [Novosphingobium sp.]
MTTRWLRSSAVGVAAALVATASAAQPTPAPGAAVPPAQRTVMLGTSDRQFLLAKVTVSDLPRSYDFYTKVLGLQWAHTPGAPESQRPRLDDTSRDFVELPLNPSGSLGDPFFDLVKLKGKAPTPDQAALVWLGFKVPDVEAALARARAAGFAPSRPTSHAGPMAFGFLKDPDGYNIELVQAASYPDR